MSGTDSLKDIALRPWPAPKREELTQFDLLEQIEQLTTERGHLRNITETTLQDDIDTGNDLPADAQSSTEAKTEEGKELSKEDQLKEVFKTQHEMASHLEWARFAANNAVDILSLVLTLDPSKRQATSFTPVFRSQGLEKGFPFASFGVSKENHRQHVRKRDEEIARDTFRQRKELVAKGARMDALDSATDEILMAARKLEREVRRETKYWQEIVSISEKGWPIQRLRAGMRNAPYAVRYGFPEASDHFKARGLAPLQMNKEGGIILHPALALKPKVLRIRISENGQIRGTTHASTNTYQDTSALEQTIQRARDSLFEEELYHEMTLEARQLMAYGVEFRDAIVHVKAAGDANQNLHRKLMIDCVARDELKELDQTLPLDWLAQSVAEGLRLLLAHEHSMRLYRRTQLPPPLTSQKRETPPPPLLRTMIAAFHHLEGVESLYTYLSHVSSTLHSAGINVKLEMTRETSWLNLATKLQERSKSGLSATDQLLDIFVKPYEGKGTLTLPSQNGGQPEELTLHTRTVIGAPTYGTEHKLILPSSLVTALDLDQHQKFSSTEEATSYLDWILALFITHKQLQADFPSRTALKGNEPRLVLRSKSSKKSTSKRWDVQVELNNGNISVLVVPHATGGSTELVAQSHFWNSGGVAVTLKDRIIEWTE